MCSRKCATQELTLDWHETLTSLLSSNAHLTCLLTWNWKCSCLHDAAKSEWKFIRCMKHMRLVLEEDTIPNLAFAQSSLPGHWHLTSSAAKRFLKSRWNSNKHTLVYFKITRLHKLFTSHVAFTVKSQANQEWVTWGQSPAWMQPDALVTTPAETIFHSHVLSFMPKHRNNPHFWKWRQLLWQLSRSLRISEPRKKICVFVLLRPQV